MSSSDDGDWDDAGFDVVEAPPTVHSITFNSSGSRFAVAHSRGADVYSLFAPAGSDDSGAAADSRLPALAPRRILRLNHRHLASEAHLPTTSSDFFEVDEAQQSGSPSPAVAQAAPRSATPAAGVGLVALLYDTNVLAVVGGGESPCQPPNRVLLFNGEYEQQRITLFGPVARVVLQNRRVIALSQTFVTIHDFGGKKLFEEPAVGWAAVAPLGSASVVRMSSAALTSMIDKASGVPSGAAGRGAATDPSALELGATTAASLRLRRMPMDATNVETNPIVAYPDQVAGSVAICDWLNPGRVMSRINAHRGDLDAISLCANGEALITASDTNTVLRVWNTMTGAKLREVRLASAPRTTFLRSVGLASRLGERASAKPAEFQPDLAFALDSRGELKFFFVGSSDAATAADDGTAPAAGQPPQQQPRNRGSLLSTFQFVSSYFASEWHCASVPLPFLPLPELMDANKAPGSGSRATRSPPQQRTPPSAALTTSTKGDGSSGHPSTASPRPSGCNEIIPVDGVAWFELPAALARYASAAASSAAANETVTVTCLAAAGVAVRIVFDAKSGKASIGSRSSFSM
uniref:Guanine nucleotide-binding protein subunit beta-like protein n=1 Tax=Neobodo designis TaxID=312471 RepID=A0A7S1PYF6_NEODS|mmetsp:Transcript_23544/g.72927  ORF Transcript_23544/g.72927 Transcript_23544/m.72927 type:complete len:578 (+) Transcript_23544:178-1911(+)